MKTRKFNLDNYSGESMIQSYSVKRREFEFYGHTFYIGKIEHLSCGLCSARLYGDDWDGALTTLFFQTNFEKPNMLAEAVVAGTRYAANHV